MIKDFTQYADGTFPVVGPMMFQVMMNPSRNGPGVIVEKNQNFFLGRGRSCIPGRGLPFMFRRKDPAQWVRWLVRTGKGVSSGVLAIDHHDNLKSVFRLLAQRTQRFPQ